jgi:hypothetical protein
MTTHRFLATDDATYEQMRAAVDAAWGYPTTQTLTCVPPAAEQWHYAPGLTDPSVLLGFAAKWPPTLSPSVGCYYVLPDPMPASTPSDCLPGDVMQWDGLAWKNCGPYRVVIALTLEWLSWEPVPTMIAGAIDAGVVSEIDEATFWAAAPKVER